MNKLIIPKFVKFNYKNKELLWLKVDKFEDDYYCGTVDNKPLSKGIKYKQYIKIHKLNVLSTMM
jgi:hypothetical protein